MILQVQLLQHNPCVSSETKKKMEAPGPKDGQVPKSELMMSHLQSLAIFSFFGHCQYMLGLPPTQDASHHQDYEPFLGLGIPS